MALCAIGVSLPALVSCGRADGALGGGFAAAASMPLVVGKQGVLPGEFVKPRAVAVDRQSGRFVVIDRRALVQVFAPDGRLAFFWRMPESANGQPVGAHFERNGDLLVSDSHYQRIVRYRLPALPESPVEPRALDPNAIAIASWGRLGKGPGEWTWGRDVVTDSEGAIYLGDTGGLNDRILKFSASGEFLFDFGGRGTEPGEFDHPAGMDIELGEDGEFLLVADMNNHRIQRFDLGGRFISAWGEQGRAPGELRFPRSVVAPGDGSIYVCEWGNNRIQKFDRDGKLLGSRGAAGVEPGEFLTPWDFDVGPGGRFVVADYGNHRVQVFDWIDS